jgi:hypothetical protein
VLTKGIVWSVLSGNKKARTARLFHILPHEIHGCFRQEDNEIADFIENRNRRPLSKRNYIRSAASGTVRFISMPGESA